MATIETRNAAITEIFQNTVVKSEFVDFFLGDLIGCGSSRLVFENRLDQNTVIKIDIGNTNDNCREFEVWNGVKKDKALKKWFAPVVRMSTCGRILVQKRCTHITKNQLPKLIPDFLADIKVQNFGMYKGKPVMFDYGANNFIEHAEVNLIKTKKKLHIGYK